MEPDPEQSSELKPSDTGSLSDASAKNAGAASGSFAVSVRVGTSKQEHPAADVGAETLAAPDQAVPSTESVSFLVPPTSQVGRPGISAYHGPGAAAAGSTRPDIVKPAPLDAPFNGALQPATDVVNQGSLLDDVSASMPDDPLPEPPKPVSRQRLIGLGLLAFGLLAAAVLGIRVELAKSHAQEARIEAPSEQLKQQQLPTTSLSKQLGTAQAASAVTVNGQLQVTGALVLQPSISTAPAVTGQMYFDAATNLLAYYNGKKYISVQGGGNTYVTNVTNNNFVTNNTNVTNVNNNTYVTNVNGGGLSGTGTPGTLAMFDSATTLGNSMVSQSGTTLNVGNGVGIVNMQGSAGGVNISTSTVSSGASGDISIQSGDSSATSSGAVTIDTGAGIINGTIIENYTFETGLEGFNNTPYGGTNAQSTAQAHGGTHSLALTLNTNSWNSVGTPDITIVPGHEYRWTAWVKAGTASSEVDTSVYLRSLNITKPTQIFTDNSSGWTEITYTFVNPLGNTAVDLGLVYKAIVATNDVHYIDDFTLTDLSTFTGLTVNLGATNAQAVNIGNSGQAGDTTITGGTTGIKISDTVGAVSMSGTDIAISSLDTVSIASGTGDATISTAAASGASANISIATGDSSTTSAGNVTIDTGVNAVTGTVVENHTYEAGTEGAGDGFGFLDSYASSTAQAHSGTHSLAVTSGNGQYGGGGNPSWYASDPVPYATPVVEGDNYAFSAWVRAQTNARTVQCNALWSSTGYAGGGQVEDDQWCTVTDSNSQWKHVSGTITAPPGAHSVGVYFTGYSTPAGEVTYIDDVTVTDVSSSPTTSQLNLGADNAQQVTIGNSSATSATTIYGHGLTLNGAQSAVTVSGGSIALTGKSSISLTAGSGSGITAKVTANTTSAFQIQGAAGNRLLNVDSSNSAITLGVSPGQIGSTTVGSDNSGGQNGIMFMKITSGSASAVTSASVYFATSASSPNNKFQVALYSDNAGSPGAKIVSTGDNLVTAPGWNTIPISASLAATTDYWIGVTENGNGNSADNTTYTNGGSYMFWAPGDVVNGTTLTYGAWPSSFAGGPAADFSAAHSLAAYLNTASSSNYAIVTDSNGHVAIGSSTTSAQAQLYVQTPSVYSDAAYFQGETTVVAANNEAFGVFGGSGSAAFNVDTMNSRISVNGNDNSVMTGALNVYGNGNKDNLLNLYAEGVNQVSVTDGGQVTFKNSTDSTAAFQIQNAGGVALLTTNTTTMTITIAGTDTSFGTLALSNAHFSSAQTTPPVIATPNNCGTGATATLGSGATDSAGSFTITTGTGGTSSTCDIQITFHNAYGSTPKSIILTPNGSAAAAARQIYVASQSGVGFFTSFGVSAGGTNSVSYSFDYWVVQ